MGQLNKFYSILLTCFLVIHGGGINAQKIITSLELKDPTIVQKCHGYYLVKDQNYSSWIYFNHGKKDKQWVTYYAKSTDLKVETYKKGKKNGLWMYDSAYGGYYGYYKNDKKVGYWFEDLKGKKEGYYKKGKKNGIWKYNDYGDVSIYEIEYKNGKKNGKWKYSDETLLIIGSYKKNKKDGIWEYYYNKKKYLKEIYKDGILINKITLEQLYDGLRIMHDGI